MRKSLLTLVFLALVFIVSAQIEKGTILLNGGTSLSFSSTNVKDKYEGEIDDEYDVSSFDIIPSFAYFVRDNFAVGLLSSFSFETDKYEDSYKNSMNEVMLVPSAIYYFPMEGKIKPFIQAGAGYSWLKYKAENNWMDDQEISYGGFTFNAGGGFAVFVKENISLNFGLSYTKATYTNKDDDSLEIEQGSLGANIGIAFYLK